MTRRLFIAAVAAFCAGASAPKSELLFFDIWRGPDDYPEDDVRGGW